MKSYPKMLYRGKAHRIVADAAEHDAAKADGWLTWREVRAQAEEPVSRPVQMKRRKAR